MTRTTAAAILGYVFAALVCAGVTAALLAALALGLEVLLNSPGSLDDTELGPAIVRILKGGLLVLTVGTGALLLLRQPRPLRFGFALGAGIALAGLAVILGIVAISALGSAFGLRGETQSWFMAMLMLAVVAFALGAVAAGVLVGVVRLAGFRLPAAAKLPAALGSLLCFGLFSLAQAPVPIEPLHARATLESISGGTGIQTRFPPSRDEILLAYRFRPSLRFDLQETRAPLDVDAFLRERGRDGQPAHEVCRRQFFTYGLCEELDGPLDSNVRDRDGILHIDANPAGGDDFERPQRIYYKAEHGEHGRIHLDYWIFYRFNDAPKLPHLTCIPGVSFEEATCFDHEGDWEGVTVTIVPEERVWHVESVAYAGHAWRYRFSWHALEAAHATEYGHPIVWVAQGSHASYPTPCGSAVRRSCRQLRSDVPDGDRDGERRWMYNPVDPREPDPCLRAHCVMRLPLTDTGGPAAWNAFGGRWGLPRCTFGTRLCVRATGPLSPFFQGRYGDPAGGRLSDELILGRPSGRFEKDG